MSDRYISVGVVSGDLEAEIIKSYLQAQGIPCVLSEEAAGRIYGLGVGPLSEVEILVASQHAEAAREALQAYWAAADEPTDD